MANKRGPKPGNAKGGNHTGKITQSVQLARVRAHEIASGDSAPLKIMLDNMMFWHRHSQSLENQIQVVLSDMQDGLSEDLIDKAQDLLKGFLSARANAQSCAVDAAPYVHPKLQSVTIKPAGQKRITVETMVASTGDRNEEVEYRKNYDPTNVTPIRRTG